MVGGLAPHSLIKRSVKKPCSSSEKLAMLFIQRLSPLVPSEASPISRVPVPPRDTNSCRVHERVRDTLLTLADVPRHQHSIDTNCAESEQRSNAADREPGGPDDRPAFAGRSDRPPTETND